MKVVDRPWPFNKSKPTDLQYLSEVTETKSSEMDEIMQKTNNGLINFTKCTQSH